MVSRTKPGRATEHEVFEKMGEAAAPLGFVHASDMVPHLDSHNRAVMILNYEELKAVRQSEFGDWEQRLCRTLRRPSGVALHLQRGENDEKRRPEEPSWRAMAH